MLIGFPHNHEDVEYFGRNVVPIVRQLEAEAAERGEHFAAES